MIFTLVEELQQYILNTKNICYKIKPIVNNVDNFTLIGSKSDVIKIKCGAGLLEF